MCTTDNVLLLPASKRKKSSATGVTGAAIGGGMFLALVGGMAFFLRRSNKGHSSGEFF